jgi:hypothetical protein
VRSAEIRADAKASIDTRIPSNVEVAEQLLTSLTGTLQRLKKIKNRPVLFAVLYPPVFLLLAGFLGLKANSDVGMYFGFALLSIPGITSIAYAASRNGKDSFEKFGKSIFAILGYVMGMAIFLFFFVLIVECCLLHFCTDHGF